MTDINLEKDVDLKKMIETLKEYSYEEGTENGEHWLALCNAYHSLRHGSDELIAILKKEIEDNYNFLVENYKIVEEEKIETRTVKVRYLEYVGS